MLHLIFVALLLTLPAATLGKEEWCSAEVDSTSATVKASGRWADVEYQLGYMVGLCTDSSSSEFGTFVAVVNGLTQRQTVGLSGTLEFPGNATVSFLLDKPSKGPQYFNLNISYGGNNNFTAVLCDKIYSGVVGPCVVDSMLPILILLLWILPGAACGLFLVIAYIRKNRYDRELLLKEREVNIKQGWQSPTTLRMSTSEQHMDGIGDASPEARTPPYRDADSEDELKSRQSTVRYYEHPLDGTLRPKKGEQRESITDATTQQGEATEATERRNADRVAAEYLMAQQLEADRQVALSKTLAALQIERVEADRIESERLTATLIEEELLEEELLEAEELENQRLAEAKREAARLNAERIEAERFEAERVEARRLEAERLEAERIEAERLEAERLEAQRLEAERLEAERIEAQRLEAERLEAERLEAERLEAERLEAERIEAKRHEAERIEAQRLEVERREAERLEAERLEAERLEAERLEAERLEAERIEAKRHEAERLEAERIEAQRLEVERLEAERIEAERLEAERLEAERLEAERLEAERRAERLEAERIEAERHEAERLEAERIEAERLEAERLEAQRLEAERLEAERIEAERVEAERIEAERLEAERLEAERIEAERLEAERLEAERIEAERLEAERIEAERLEAERIEAERLEAERLEAERLEAERQDEEDRQEAARAASRKLEEEEMLAASVSYNAEYRDLMMMLQKPDAKERAKAFLGFSLAQSVEESKLVVDGVYRDGPAFQVGVRMEDTLTHIAGTRVSSIQEARVQVDKHCRPAELAALTFLRPTGESYTVKLWVMTAEPKYRGKAYFFDTDIHVKDQSPRPKHRQNAD